MKLPLATGVLSSVAVFDCSPAATSASGRWTMRVDRTFDRLEQPGSSREPLSLDCYREGAPSDRWEVVIRGSSIHVHELGGNASLEGFETSSVQGVRYFELRAGKGVWGGAAGGRFILRGREVELTVFGSDVPVMMSERGTLISRP